MTVKSELLRAPEDPVHAFMTWIQTAPPGQRFRYYRGFLAVGSIDPKSLDALLRKTSADAYLSGLYELTQQRHSEGDYSYYATRRRIKDTGYRIWFVSDRMLVTPIHYARKHGVPA